MTTYINLFGGPGIGKSTTAASIFVEMKKRGMTVELVTEVAKDFIWEGRMQTLDIQPYVTIKQFRNLYRLKDKVDFVITDAPILLGCIYADKFTPTLPRSYWQFIVDLHNQELNPSVNILLDRSFKYDPIGRYQNENEALELDRELEFLLKKHSINHSKVAPNDAFLFIEALLSLRR